MRPTMLAMMREREIPKPSDTFTVNGKIKEGTADGAIDRGRPAQGLRLARLAATARDESQVSHAAPMNLFGRKFLHHEAADLPSEDGWLEVEAGSKAPNWDKEWDRMGRGQPAREELDARRQVYPDKELRLTPEGVQESIEQIDPEKVCSMSTIGGVMVRRIFRGDTERIKKYLLPHLQAHLDGRLSATSRCPRARAQYGVLM